MDDNVCICFVLYNSIMINHQFQVYQRLYIYYTIIIIIIFDNSLFLSLSHVKDRKKIVKELELIW